MVKQNSFEARIISEIYQKFAIEVEGFA